MTDPTPLRFEQTPTSRAADRHPRAIDRTLLARRPMLIEDLGPRDRFDQGLAHDFATLIDRRRMLRLMGATGLGLAAFGVAACAPGSATGTPGAPGTASATLTPVRHQRRPARPAT